jgi:hypothetical protein
VVLFVDQALSIDVSVFSHWFVFVSVSVVDHPVWLQHHSASNRCWFSLSQGISFVFFCFAVSPFVRCSLSDGRLSVSGARVLGQGACLVSFFVFGDSLIFI